MKSVFQKCGWQCQFRWFADTIGDIHLKYVIYNMYDYVLFCFLLIIKFPESIILQQKTDFHPWQLTVFIVAGVANHQITNPALFTFIEVPDMILHVTATMGLFPQTFSQGPYRLLLWRWGWWRAIWIGTSVPRLMIGWLQQPLFVEINWWVSDPWVILLELRGKFEMIISSLIVLINLQMLSSHHTITMISCSQEPEAWRFWFQALHDWGSTFEVPKMQVKSNTQTKTRE